MFWKCNQTNMVRWKCVSKIGEVQKNIFFLFEKPNRSTELFQSSILFAEMKYVQNENLWKNRLICLSIIVKSLLFKEMIRKLLLDVIL